MEDPRDHALRKFDDPQEWTVLDVIVAYATDPPIAIATLLDAVRPAARPGARICELGFGSGWLIEEMAAEFPDVRLCGLDLSRRGVQNAPEHLGDRAEFMLADMEQLPFADVSFDAITTNWTLYFMRDIDAALVEMRRCVKAGGLFVAATVAPDHMREFDEHVALAVRRALEREREPDIGARFDTETGLPFMQRAFGDVELREYAGEMVLPDVETAMVLWPGYGPQLVDAQEDARARVVFEELVAEEIAREGVWRIRRHDGVFVARV
jgi:SAM-dependent methyltransferase